MSSSYSPTDFHAVSEYVRSAARFVEPALLAYIDGGSGRDLTAQRNIKAFDAWGFIPRHLGTLNPIDLSCTLPGLELAHPTMLAPIAFQALFHPEAETAVAQAAEATETAMIASSCSSHSIESIAQSCRATLALQLYQQTQLDQTIELTERALKQGCKALFLTVDAAMQLPSDKTLAAGFTMPNLSPGNGTQLESNSLSVGDACQHRVSLADLQELIQSTSLPVYVKGIMSLSDAEAALSAGASGLVISNHGGRTIDGQIPSLEALPQLRQALGVQAVLLFDGGIRSGGDVFKAIALGADAVLIGRLAVYGLAIGGALGLAHLLKLLREELEMHMIMTACTTLADIRSIPNHLLKQQVI